MVFVAIGVAQLSWPRRDELPMFDERWERKVVGTEDKAIKALKL